MWVESLFLWIVLLIIFKDGGTFDDKDLFDIGGGGDYKPDGGRSGGKTSALP